MDSGASEDETTTPQVAPKGFPRGRTATIVIGALVGAVVLALAGAWQLYRDFEDNFSCPPEVWAQGVAADVRALLPSSAIWTDPTISDCDDRRAVTAESVPVTGNETDLVALQTGVVGNAGRSGWSDLDGSHCLEKEIEGLRTSLGVVVDGDVVRVQAVRGAC